MSSNPKILFSFLSHIELRIFKLALDQLVFNKIKYSKDVHYSIGFNDPEGFRACGYDPELSEMIVNQNAIHPYSDVDANDQNMSLNKSLCLKVCYFRCTKIQFDCLRCPFIL